MKKIKQLLKSYKFWITLSCCIVIVLEVISKIVGFNIDKYLMISLLSSVCMLLISLGVIDVDDKSKEDIEDDIKDKLNDDK